MNKQTYFYILANKKNGTLYIGVTRDLRKRVYLHKKGLIDGFTKKYNNEAILIEKRLKKWKRNWEIKLIEQNNPYWRDLYYNIIK